MDELDLYMENLDEYINDENKVITYKWLSINLKIPCNSAKRLLHHFASTRETKDEDAELHVTYLVMGTVQMEDKPLQTKISIVPARELSHAKEQLDEVSCVHVYSISRSKLKDQSATLYSVDYDSIKQNLCDATSYGGISCPAASLRSDAAIASLRQQATYRPSTPQDSRKAPDPRLVKPKVEEAAPPADKTKTAKGSLASMFATQKTAPKDQAVKEDKKPVCKKPSNDSKKSGNISGFFTKGAKPRENEVKTKNNVKEEIKNEVVSPSKDKSPVKQKEEDNGGSEEAAPVKCEEPVSVKNEKDSPVKRSSKKRPAKKTPPVSKRGKAKPHPKRSRIMQMDSSSEEEDSAKEESDMETEECPAPSPPAIEVSSEEEEEEEVVPGTPQITNSQQARGKKRKLVDRTFQDEEGFFVTKKEYVDVTDSESDDSVPPPSKKQDRRPSTPSPSKQESLRNNDSSSPTKSEKESKSPTKSGKGSKAPTKSGKGSKAAKEQAAKKSSTKASPTKTKQVSIMNFFQKKK